MFHLALLFAQVRTIHAYRYEMDTVPDKTNLREDYLGSMSYSGGAGSERNAV